MLMNGTTPVPIQIISNLRGSPDNGTLGKLSTLVFLLIYNFNSVPISA